MVDNPKRPRLVGNFIRQRRESMGLSQRALGLLFSPPVTTQFISNVERGVTPLPPTHVPTLTKALVVNEAEIMALLEREYTLKLSGRVGKAGDVPDGQDGNGVPNNPSAVQPLPSLTVSRGDFEFIRSLYDAYRQADQKTRDAFSAVCESILNVPKIR